MKRGELYLVHHPSSSDPKKQRVFVIVSRQLLLDSSFSSAICAPVYSRRDGLHTQVNVGIDEGLKHDSSIHCDELVSLSKSLLTHYVRVVVARQTPGSRPRPGIRLGPDAGDFSLTRTGTVDSGGSKSPGVALGVVGLVVYEMVGFSS